MNHVFRWRGEDIPNIRAWASARHERMVEYYAERQMPNSLTGTLDVETQRGEMPESFWDSLMMADGWHYIEIGRSAVL